MNCYEHEKRLTFWCGNSNSIFVYQTRIVDNIGTWLSKVRFWLDPYLSYQMMARATGVTNMTLMTEAKIPNPMDQLNL